MKKFLAALLAVALLASLPMASLAEVSYTATNTNNRYVTLAKATNCYTARTDAGYQVFDANGNALSAAYGYISIRNNGEYYEVANENGTNTMGLLNAQGQEILPMAYGDIVFMENGWVMAHELVVVEGDVGEYTSSSTGEKFNVNRTDVVYNGKLIGSLSREDYIKSYRTSVRGAYLLVKKSDTEGYWLDGDFNRVVVTDDDYISTSEFEDIYKQGVMHAPTQQWAFTEGCTLTADQVTQTVWFDYLKGNLFDLQGNQIAASLPYESVRYRGDYMLTRQHSLYGIMTNDGTVLVDPTYTEIGGYEDLFVTGYAPALTEKGELHFLDTTGAVTASVPYQLTSSDYKGFSNGSAFAAVKNMGLYTIITATAGELPEKYQDVSGSPQAGSTVISVMKDDKWGVIDMNGNAVVPFEYEYALEISRDNSLILGRDANRDYILYILNQAEETNAPYDRVEKMSGEIGDEPVDVPAETEAPAAVADGSWACTCGSVNTGKFCTECGATEPVAAEAPAAVEDGSWACACGSVNTGKFCPECGSAKPAEAPAPAVCAGCGYEPGEDVPKFCPECGTKFE